MTNCRVFASLLLAAATLVRGAAQDTSTPPAKSPEVQAMEARTAQLNAEAAAANAQAAVTNSEAAKIKAQTDYGKALVPTLPPGKSGTLAVNGTDAPVESALLAYRELGAAARAIACRVTCTAEAPLVIHSATELAGLTALTAFGLQVESLQTRLEALRKQNAKVVAPNDYTSYSMVEASAGISAAMALVSLFRVDTAYNIKDITYDEKTLIALVAEALRTNPKSTCKSVYYPTEMPVLVMRKETELQNLLANLAVLVAELRRISLERTPDKPKADKTIEQYTQEIKTSKEKFAGYKARQTEIEELEKKLNGENDPIKKAAVGKELKEKQESLTSDKNAYGDDETKDPFKKRNDKLNDWTNYRDLLSRYLSAIDVSVTAGEAFLSAITKADDGSGGALLSRLLRAERLRLLLETGNSKATMLELSVPKLGGTIKQDSGFFRNEVSFSGGAVVSYLQYRMWKENGEADGAILTSGAIPVYSPFLTSKDILKELSKPPLSCQP